MDFSACSCCLFFLWWLVTDDSRFSAACSLFPSRYASGGVGVTSLDGTNGNSLQTLYKTHLRTRGRGSELDLANSRWCGRHIEPGRCRSWDRIRIRTWISSYYFLSFISCSNYSGY